MKRKTALLMALIIGFALSFSAFGEDVSAAGSKAITKTKALSIALGNAKLKKSQVCRIKVRYDREDKAYDVRFIRKKNKADYEYDIAPASGRILKKNIEYRYKKKCTKKRIPARCAQKKVAKYSKMPLSLIKKGKVQFEKKKAGYKYEIKFYKGKYEFECDVLARNGQIIEWEFKYIGK